MRPSCVTAQVCGEGLQGGLGESRGSEPEVLWEDDGKRVRCPILTPVLAPKEGCDGRWN